MIKLVESQQTVNLPLLPMSCYRQYIFTTLHSSLFFPLFFRFSRKKTFSFKLFHYLMIVVCLPFFAAKLRSQTELSCCCVLCANSIKKKEIGRKAHFSNFMTQRGLVAIKYLCRSSVTVHLFICLTLFISSPLSILCSVHCTNEWNLELSWEREVRRKKCEI